MAFEREVSVSCYWNGSIKYGPDGLYYEGSTSRMFNVKRKNKQGMLSRFLDGLYLITGLDKQRSKLDVIGRYPVAVSPQQFTYLLYPVVDDTSLETMLQVPSNHPSINTVEFYLEVTPISKDVTSATAVCSSPLENPGSSLKRQRTEQPQEANVYVGMDATLPPDNLEWANGSEILGVNNSNVFIQEEPNVDFVNGLGGGDGVAQMVNLAEEHSNAHKDMNVPDLDASDNACLNKGDGSSAAKPRVMSSLWVDDHELSVGMCFKNKDELKKAVDWCSNRERKKCVVRETMKDEYTFECIRWKCNWSLGAARVEKHGLVVITKFSGPHTCSPIIPENFDLEFVAEEIERLIRLQPTVTIAELESWWFEKFGYSLGTSEMKAAKHKLIKRVYGDWDQSFGLLPKLMAAFQSSNGLVVDWRYDLFPNPEFASFNGVFWAFSQSIEGFQHCRPVIVVDTKDLNGKYPMKLMIALGVDPQNYYFPLAFAVTEEVSSDSWRWFLTTIRDKVTQRKGLCLVSRPHPDILSVVNEPGSLWQEPLAYHRFCLDSMSSQFDDMFHNDRLKSLVIEAGSTKLHDEFDSHMETIKKENPEARRWLNQFPPHKWALAHDNGLRYGVIALEQDRVFGIFESSKSLGLPVTALVLLMFDELRLSFHTSLCESRGRLNRGDMYIKPVMDKLEKFRTASFTYTVMPLDKNLFQVTAPSQKDRWIVQLNESSCTCGKFQRKKFPCPHALAVCEKLKINPLQYVDDCYTLERCYKTYAATFNHVPEVSAWSEASIVLTLFPPVIPPPPTNLSDSIASSDDTTTKTKTSTIIHGIQSELLDSSEDHTQVEVAREISRWKAVETFTKSSTNVLVNIWSKRKARSRRSHQLIFLRDKECLMGI